MVIRRQLLSTVLLGALSLAAGAAEPDPSAELMEFLAEWQDTDEETFELLVEHGRHDAEAENRTHERE